MGKILKLKKLYSVPDTNGASNFGGIAYGDSTIFAIKANQAETIATLHEIRQDGSVLRTKFTGLCHTNGLTYYNGSVYVPLWGSKQAKKGVCRISIADHKKHVISADFKLSNIAHYKGNYFITRTSTSSDKKTQTFHVIKIVDSGITKIMKFSVKNPLVSDGYTTNQDIYYNDGYLYVMETKSSLLKSAVLVYKIGDPEPNVAYKATDTWTSSNSSKWEIESMCITDQGKVLFGMNTSSDGVYVEEEEEVKKEGDKMVFNIVAGHSKLASGASKYLNEVTEDRKVKDKLICVLRESGHTVYDCTSDASTPSKVLSEQVAKCKQHKGVDVHIHFNAGTSDPNSKTTGTEVFVYSSSSKCRDQAKKVCDRIASLGFTNRGVKYSTALYVLKNSSNPSMLIEVCFVDDKDDYNLYKSVGVDAIAKEIAKGLIGEVKEIVSDLPYIVRVTSQDLNVRKGPSASTEVVTIVAKGECYTITDIVYSGTTAWGKLKSGAGYISLAYTERV